MSSLEITLLLLVMLIGVIGVVIPFIPGLLLIEATALVWAIDVGDGAARWLVLAGVTAIVVVGTIAKYVVPARSLAGSGSPRTTTLAGIVGAIVGFFVIPIVGLAVGFVVGVFAAECLRRRELTAAWQGTVLAVKAVGISVLVELVAAAAATSTWFVGALLVRG